MDIQVRISKTALADPARLKKLEQPMLLGKAMAEQLLARQFTRAQSATPGPGGYSTTPSPVRTSSGRAAQVGRNRKGQYVIGRAYADLLGLKETHYASSADFHRVANTKFGGYTSTGGMMRGLWVRNLGDGALIEFGGRSLGSSSVQTPYTRPKVQVTSTADGKGKKTYVFEVGRDKTGKLVATKQRELAKDSQGKVKYRKSPKMVENWRKASVVFAHHGICLVQPTDEETRDLVDAMMDITSIATTYVMGGEITNLSGSNGEFYNRIVKAFGVARRR